MSKKSKNKFQKSPVNELESIPDVVINPDDIDCDELPFTAPTPKQAPVVKTGMIKTMVINANIFNIDTQDKKINEMVSQGYEYLHSMPLSSMEMAVRFRKK